MLFLSMAIAAQKNQPQTPIHKKPMPTVRVIIELLLLLLALSPSNSAHAKVKNIKPLAIAGNAQTVLENSRILLDGTQSIDSDGHITKWQWTQIKGSKVKIYNPKEKITSFISPKLKRRKTSEILMFKLTVTDNNKATATAKVQITVILPPTCTLPQILQNTVCVTPPPVCVQPQILKNGICIDPPITCRAPQILKNGECITPQLGCDLPMVLKDGECITPQASGIFNDTGLVDCSDGSFNVQTCGISQFPRQDAEFGRDATHYNDLDGHAGFSFTKISATGTELPLDASEWSCIKDNITGLLWEVKTDDNGLHDKDLNYSYYSPTFNPKNEFATASDVTGFITTVNNKGFCGVNNWRLPNSIELQGIVDYSLSLPGPAIDQSFFANTRNTVFWTVSPYPRNENGAWVVYFDDGRVFDDYRNRNGGGAARLVSGTTLAHSYSISSDGQEVTDNATGLIWQRCVEGMTWNGTTCIGVANGYMFQEALHRADSKQSISGQNWRLPNMKELASLIDTSINQEIVIDENAFPNTPNDQYWSSSSYSTDAFFAWVVHSFYGSVYYTYTEDTGLVRLVRNKD